MFGVALVALVVVLIVCIAGLWRRPSPNHSFVFDLVRTLAEKQIATKTRKTQLSYAHDNDTAHLDKTGT